MLSNNHCKIGRRPAALYGSERMNDNTEYWKDLLGDDFSDDLMDILKSEPDPQAGKAAEKTVKPQPDEPDEGLRFYNYDISSGNSGGKQNNTAKTPPAGTNGAPKPVAGKGAGNGVPPEYAPKVRPQAGRDKHQEKAGDDFSVDFDFEGEYRDVPDNRPLRQRREKRTGCLGGALYAVFIICICLLLASLAWLAATDILGLGNENEEIQVTIPDNYTIDSVSEMLHEDGLIKYTFLFKLYAEFSKADEKITAGTYELNKNYDYRALVNGMTIHGGKRVEIDVTIPEGYTLKQVFELFAANKVCTEEELWDAAANYDFDYDFLDKATIGDKHRLEGFLFPDTYTFYVGDVATRAISKMLDNFESKFTEEYLTRAEELGYSVREIVTIASMIEKEAGADSERDLVASVIYNRLKSKSFPYLQIDATIYYAIAETGETFSTSVDSPYNTYKVKGLPAGPIANPGVASIRAALYPQTTKYYYYALNTKGTHDFFKDQDAFNAFINSDEYGG